MSNSVLRPPGIPQVEGQVVFLAGPIQGAPNWQDHAIEIFDSKTSDLTIASPRKNYDPDEFVYEKQVDWETHFLRQAGRLGVVMFWLANQVEETPGRSYAQTSRFELGEWTVRHQAKGTKLAIGIEEGFGNERYIRRRLGQDCPDLPIFDNLPDTCNATLGLLRE